MMRGRAFILALLCMFLLISNLFSQGPERTFHHLTIREGLSQSTVRAIHQDRYGYLWFGSADGLNRYDGSSFAIYKHNPEDPATLGGNSVLAIHEDRQGRFWVGTQAGGLSLYHHEYERFRTFTGDAETPFSLSDNTVWDILEDSHGELWIGTSYGLNRMEKEEERFSHYLTDPQDPLTISGNTVFRLYEDSAGTLWVGTDNGFSRYNRDEGAFTRYEYFHQEGSALALENVRAIAEDREGRFWIGTERRGLFLFDRDSESLTRYSHDPADPYSISGNAIFSIIVDSEGEVWIGTGNDGINIYDSESDGFFRYQQNPDHAGSINNNAIQTLYLSREKMVWAGTFLGGVNVYESRRDMFEHFANDARNPSSLSNNAVQALHEDRRGFIWIGTDGGGLNRFDPATRHVERWNRGSGKTNPDMADVILDIHETDSGIWLATYEEGIALLNPDDGRLRYFRNDPVDGGNGPATNDIFSISETRDGKLWLSTNGGGVSVYDPETGRFTHIGFQQDNRPESGLLNMEARYVYEDSEGGVWIGTYAGTISRYDLQNGIFRHYSLNENSFFPATVVQHIIEDSKGRLLMASRGGGLLIYNRELDQIEPLYTESDDLPNNVLHSIAEDPSGNLWISSNRGLTRLNPLTDEITLYEIKQGLNNSEFLPASFTADRDGFFYFGGVNGFNRFHPDSIRVDSTVSPPILTDLYLFNEPLRPGEEQSPLQKPFRFTDRLILPHSASVITLGFGALNFSSHRGVDFHYMLEGFETQWNRVGSQNRATYTNLSPGEYHFRVRAVNAFGVVSEEEASVWLVIRPPFWRTWWFMLLAGLSLLVAAYTFYRMRVESIHNQNLLLEKRIREKTEELEVSNQAKSKLFSIIAHDLKNYAANFQGLSELIEMDSDGHEELKPLSDQLSTTSRQFTDFLGNILDWARSQTENIQYNPREFNLANVIKHVCEQASPGARAKGIELKQEVPSDLMVHADSDLLAIVLHNLISNAIKFSHTGSAVEIIAKTGEKEVLVAVRDKGVGMGRDTVDKLLKSNEFRTTKGTSGEKGSGLGFSVCKDFIQRNKGSLILESKPGSGTTIQFTLPAVI
ncbi:MAG: hypothetical protein EA360_06430 [Balneolaceae bacterium]|nr:MAG: hypothetical protein EA360_06430 [Balneolaceae bacterium]